MAEENRNWLQLQVGVRKAMDLKTINYSAAINGRNNTDTCVWNGNFLTKLTNGVSRTIGHLFIPVVPCGSIQCHGSLSRPNHDCPVSCLCSSQMWHHCLWPTAATKKQKREPSGGLSYLPGRMTHGHAMRPHASLTTVIWSVSYLIGGGGSTVYPPLGIAWRTITQHKWFTMIPNWRKRWLVRANTSINDSLLLY